MERSNFSAVLVLFFLSSLSFSFISPSEAVNNRPIIGVLAQEKYDGKSQYFAASYVKWIEMAGGRAVPIFVKMNASYYEELFDRINGALLPGGGTPLTGTGYSDVSDRLLDAVARKHQQGIHFPVWASCLGFEKVITYFINDSISWESKCFVENLSLNLNFTPEARIEKVRMLQNNSEIYRILQTKNVTANYHKICLKPEVFRKFSNLSDNFVMVSTNTFGDDTYVSTLEHRTLPIYAAQWHVEKNQFEWLVKKGLGNINHDADAIAVGQHFGNFFLSEARKNDQKFPSQEEENRNLIYSFDKYRIPHTDHSSFVETFDFPLPYHF